MRTALISLAIVALLTGCTNTPEPTNPPPRTTVGGGRQVPQNLAPTTGVGSVSDDALWGGSSSSYKYWDRTEEQFDPQRVEQFLRMRCLTLGRNLTLLSSEDPAIAELAWGRIDEMYRADTRRIRETIEAGHPPQATTGLVIPRYISAHLRKPRADWDLRWLRIQGELLQITYEFEKYDREKWEVAIGRMMQLGKEGREYLAAQMVVRMRISNADFRDHAKDVLVNFVPDEAIEPLVAGTFVEIGGQVGVFPSQCVSVLAEIGPKAVPTIIGMFQDKDGKHVPANDENWFVRRYFVSALGAIGDASAVDTLISELDSMKFAAETRRMTYASRLVDALGRIRDRKAVRAIVREWKQYTDPADFMPDARQALFRITGRVYIDPNEVPLGS